MKKHQVILTFDNDGDAEVFVKGLENQRLDGGRLRQLAGLVSWEVKMVDITDKS